MKPKHTFILLLVLFCIFAICLPVYGADTTVYGCYKKAGGQLRIVNKDSRCLPSELSISWNQAPSVAPAATASAPVRQVQPELSCSGGYGWCPDGFGKSMFHILDSAVNESSVVAINITNPLLLDYGCEVATKGTGEFQIICMGVNNVQSTAVLQYAVFNP